MSIISQKSCRVKYGYISGTVTHANIVQMGIWVVPYYVGDYNGIGSSQTGISANTIYQKCNIVGYQYNTNRISTYQGIVSPHPTSFPACIQVCAAPSSTWLTQCIQYLYDIGVVSQGYDSSYQYYSFEFYNDVVYYVFDRTNNTLTVYDNTTDAQLCQMTYSQSNCYETLPFPIYSYFSGVDMTGGHITDVVFGENSSGSFQVYHIWSRQASGSNGYFYHVQFNSASIDSTLKSYIETSVNNALNEIYDISADCSVTLNPSAYEYTGSAIEPNPVVVNTLTGTTLVLNTDYILTYSDNVNLGTASILITGAGNYSGAVSVTFYIYSSDNPYDPSGGSSTGGGNGTFDDSSDDIDFAPLPSVSAVDTNFVTVYVPTLAQLQAVSAYMWTSNFIDNIKHLFGDPIDAVLGLQIIPVAVSYSAGTCKIGNVDTGISINVADSQYVMYDCGNLSVAEFYGGFLDYSPNTKVELYLPFIGFRELNTDDVMDATIRIHYMIDIISGECVAEVKITKNNDNLNSVIYRYNGQCANPVPVTHSTWTGVITSLGGALGGAGTALAASVAGGPAGLVVGGLASAAYGVANAKPKITKGGLGNGSSGFLAYRTPYIAFTIPRIVPTDHQNEYIGIPSFVEVPLASISGFTQVAWINMESVPSVDEETDEILKLLAEGIII